MTQTYSSWVSAQIDVSQHAKFSASTTTLQLTEDSWNRLIQVCWCAPNATRTMETYREMGEHEGFKNQVLLFKSYGELAEEKHHNSMLVSKNKMSHQEFKTARLENFLFFLKANSKKIQKMWLGCLFFSSALMPWPIQKALVGRSELSL